MHKILTPAMMMMPVPHRFLSLLLLFLVVNELVVTNAFNVPEGSPVRTSHTRGGDTPSFSKSWNPRALHLSQQEAALNGDSVVVGRDFRLAGMFLLGSFGLAKIPILKFVLAPLAGLLGVLFLVQTFRLKIVCDEDTFALLNTARKSGENLVVGGENRWTYDSFVNYEFFPKGWVDLPQGPILVYFKETQTPSDKWEKGPGAKANSEQAIKNGAVPGQVHFFPALCNTKQLRAEWQKRGCSKLE